MQSGRTTVSKFLIEQLHGTDDQADLAALLVDVTAAVKAISAMTSKGALGGYLGALDSQNVQGETQKKLDVLSNDAMIQACEWGGLVAGMASEEMDDPYTLPKEFERGPYLLIFDPLDGSSNTDVNVSVGTIFSVLRHTRIGDPTVQDYLQPGTMYEANPIGMIVEQAGGAASTGRGRILEVQPTSLHQRVPVMLGSKNEIERLERYHAEYDRGEDKVFDSPLFKERSLYRDEARG